MLKGCVVHINIELISYCRRNLKDAETIPKLRHLQNFIKTYRELQVLHNVCNSYFQSLFFPAHKFILVNISVIGIYGSIKVPGPRSIIMTVGATMSLMYLSLLFRRMGKLYEKSVEVLHSWKGERGKYIKKFVLGSKPIRVKIGFYYYVRKTTVIIIWSTVLNFSTNMLLSF